jgi:hypothetical protein
MSAKSKGNAMQVSTYPIPSEKQFTLSMPAQREILGIFYNPRSGGFAFRVEQMSETAEASQAQPQKDFSFQVVALDEKFEKAEGASYLGEIMLVTDPDADRPVSEAFFVYGVRKDS